MGSPRESAWTAALPWGLSSIATTVISLAVFLTFASLLFASHPLGSAVGGYFYGVHFEGVGAPLYERNEPQINGHGFAGSNSLVSNQSKNAAKGDGLENKVDMRPNTIDSGQNNNGTMFNKNMPPEPGENKASTNLQHEEASAISSPESKSFGQSSFPNAAEVNSVSSKYIPPSEADKDDSFKSGCDLYKGQWVYDSAGPLYQNNSCPIITQMQNCQGNGRPDKDYENWRWKPSQCELPRLDAKNFLKLMRGKTLAFVGDSVARNQMESMLCILWQAEVPINKGNKRMHRWFFKSTSTTVIRIWSSWLVRQTSEPFDHAPRGIDKLHLDAPDPNLMDLLPRFDVTVLSSGHWFAKQSVYILNGSIVGGQLWWPDKSRPMRVNNVEAFAISTETALTSVATHPNYTGLTLVRSYSPDHYEGGAWNTGGSCTGKVRPLEPGAVVENGFTNAMHEKQVQGFRRAAMKVGLRLRLMDITRAFSYRHDGHPGPYRSRDPKKTTKRGRDGRPPPQDCLHWCMPGPVDTWNELVAEVVRREFAGRSDRPTFS